MRVGIWNPQQTRDRDLIAAQTPPFMLHSLLTGSVFVADSIPELPAAHLFLLLFYMILNERYELHCFRLIRFPQSNVHVLPRTSHVGSPLTMTEQQFQYVHPLLLYSISYFHHTDFRSASNQLIDK